MRQITNVDLMSIEANPDILMFKNKEGTPWWFYIRYDFLFIYLNQKLMITKGLTINREYNINGLNFLFKAVIHNIFNKNKHNYKIAYYVTSRFQNKNGKYFNQFSDPFYELNPDNTIVYENATLNWQWYKPRLYNNYISYAPNLVKTRLVSLFYKKIPKEVYGLVEFLSKRAKEIFDIELTNEEKNQFAKLAVRNYQTYRSHFEWFVRNVKKKQTKLIIAIGSSYSHYCDLNRLARREGIIVADMQHGAICSSNLLYSYDKHILDTEELKAIIPDYYLSYGSWWSEQTNIPYKKIVVGNLLRKQLLCNIDSSRDKKKIIVIGAANNTKAYLDLTQSIYNKYSSYEVIFRPHPTEKKDTEILSVDYNVNIDYGNDLYQELADSYAVISEMSTVMYEAVGLANRIIIWRTQYSINTAPTNSFEEFKTKEELFTLLDNTNVNINYKETDFWEKNVEKNYENFIKLIFDK